ncbi:putative transposase [Methylobacterium phyllostachyos]|uniref:Putative transposase n=1 Tax=Methylobacterium phyllostachyos TaxID=582672 RepID=A0A1H0I839_9HYPH|nr:transposase [Methylobacterium phyllostachyos]SDO27271.1 putative transposase [Methylobacterium phyllostachyos]
MRRSLHTDQEIAFLLDEAARGIPIADICASARISLGTFYRWRRRLGGLKPAGVIRLDQVERENAGLRAEVHRLRAVLLKQPLRAEPARPIPTERAGLRQKPSHRGAHACVGRFAFVRSAN